MELQTISQVSSEYKISTRMLRYYEQVGLIESKRKEDYAYRVYDETAIKRLRQVIVLRKLRIPIKQIVNILNNPNAVETVEIFQKNINELDEEIIALSTVKSILLRFIEELNEKIDTRLRIDLLSEETVFSIISSLPFSKNYLKESLSMENLNKSDEDLMKLKEKYIRIISLPAMTVAEVNFYGDTILPGEEMYLSEEQVKETDTEKIMGNHFDAGLNAIDTLIKDNRISEIIPDFRLYGFANCSKMEEYGPFYGFGRWLTIPDDMDVPHPFVKKHFNGGLYCAYSRPLPLNGGDSDEWEVLNHWVCNNDRYEYDGGRGEPLCNYGMLEEYLNYINLFNLPLDERLQQTDLIMPIKEKN